MPGSQPWSVPHMKRNWSSSFPGGPNFAPLPSNSAGAGAGRCPQPTATATAAQTHDICFMLFLP